MITTEQVFGISTKQVLSYIEREIVDGKFVQAIDTDHHIVIYGSSKQGKTSLRTKHLKDDNCVIVNCSPRMETSLIYQSILRRLNVKIETTETSELDISGGVKIKTGFKAIFAFFGEGSAEAEAQGNLGTKRLVNSEYVGHDLADAQTIGDLITKCNFDKFVILENFHYLPIETQKALAFDLKTFHEMGIRFIILGVWKEANQLLVHNGDLQDRITEVPVEPWESADFRKITAKGCEILNVQISDVIVNSFASSAYGNVGLFQEFIKVFCELNGITGKVSGPVFLGNESKVAGTFSIKLQDQRGQLIKILQGIAAKSRTDGTEPMILPYYLVMVILSIEPDQLLQGIERNILLQKLREAHHREKKDTIRPNDLGNLLSQLPSIQRDINPPFIYYDENQRRLKVVDSRQFFVLANVDRTEIMDDIPFPLNLKNSSSSGAVER